MNKTQKKLELISTALSFLVVFTLAFPSEFNALAIYLLCGFSLFHCIKRRVFLWKNRFVFLSVSFFLLHVIHLFFDENLGRTSFEIEKKLGFLVLPLFWYNLPISQPKKVIERALDWYAKGMSFFGLFLLGYALIFSNYLEQTTSFFYHQFVQVFDGNAIYYSLLFTLSLIIFIEKNRKSPSAITLLQIGFTSLIIILLSSKIYLILLVGLILYFLSTIPKKRLALGFVVVVSVTGFILNQTSITSRFQDINFKSFFSVKQEVHTSTYFDGFTLRKELWNISLNLVEKETKTFLMGVGPGDAQDEIDKSLKENNFYTGTEAINKTGYLGYNSHNQYIQTLLETGFFGLILLILMIYYSLMAGWKSNNRILLIFSLVTLVSYFTESYLNRQIGIISFVGFNSMMLCLQPDQFVYTKIVKRGVDLVFSFLVIVFILSWLLPILGFFIYLDTHSFPLFVQDRVGEKGKIFRCFKLRTMVDNREANRVPAKERDKRITKFGRILRKYAVDELPQFINVFLGEMSIVGPRPLMVSEEQEWNEKKEGFSKRLIVKPGVTGLAQANGYKGIINHPADLSIRFRLDKLYIQKQSLWVDFKIIVRTIFYIFT